MRVDRLLELLLRKLEPDEAVVGEGIARAQRVARILRNDPEVGVLETRIGGSCGKGTAVNPVMDVDLFVYLDEAAWRSGRGEVYGPHTVLRRFYERLSRTFAKPIRDGDVTLRLQDHSVRVQYLREGAVAIDVVPALWADQNRAEIVRIPERSSREWRETCVTRQARLLDKYDAPNRYLRRGIRLLKYWRRVHRLQLLSYAIELLAVSIARRKVAAHPRAILLGVLNHVVQAGLRAPVIITDYVPAAKQPRRPDSDVVIWDPAVSGNNVGATMTLTERRSIIAAARHALGRLSAAEWHLEHDRLREARTAVGRAFRRRSRSLASPTSTAPPAKRSWWF